MGCCESTGRASASPLLPPAASDQTKGASVAMGIEEKVKEVLCETPAASKPPVALSPLQPLQNPETPPIKTGQMKRPAAAAIASEKSVTVPEEIRRLSGRASTTAANPISDNGAQRRSERSLVKPQHSRSRSFSGNFGTSTGRCSGKSPARIRPGGIGGSMRIVQSREASCAQRLDPGERSVRISGPSRAGISGGRRPAVDRVPPLRRTDLSPGRIRRNPNWSSKRMDGGDPKQSQSNGRESLESPSVSLECFIFL